VAQLVNSTKSQTLTQNLIVAKSMASRLKGLLGKSKLDMDEMMWIHHCNSIHTFFMKFTIDCAFLDKQMRVCGIREQVKPWRITLPIVKARSVIEMKAGQIATLNIQVGDQLYVGN
jgi:uncharacterized membrane protein (UPF0127 family)